MNSLRTPHPRSQRGAAALIVVMLLFFIVSLVAAYAGRNLIFEQKTSVNQYRATEAFEAAEAGLEWALAMLNGGRVDANCAPSTDVTQPSFRERFLISDAAAPDPKGLYEPRTWTNAGALERLQPSCVRRANDPLNPNQNPWSCSCRTDAAATPALPAGGGIHPAFRVCFERVPLDPLVPLGPVQPGAVRIVSTGRTSVDGFVGQTCEQRGEGTAGDAAATVSVVAALSSALATPPSAALTVRRNFDPAPNLALHNTDRSTNGLTAQVGVLIRDPTTMPNLVTLPGSPAHLSVVADGNLAAWTAPQLFAAIFRMSPSTYRQQPAAVILDDCAVACSAKLNQAVHDNPGRPIWINGDANFDADMVIGSALEPVVIVASGDVNFTAASSEIFGLLYSQAVDWINGGDGAVVRGAAIAESNFGGIGAPTIEYDPTILNRLRISHGSLVRVPGSWRDFP